MMGYVGQGMKNNESAVTRWTWMNERMGRASREGKTGVGKKPANKGARQREHRDRGGGGGREGWKKEKGTKVAEEKVASQLGK